MIRAKFYVVSLKKTKFTDGIGTVVELLPVISGSDENKEFYKWTPSGRVELGTINDKVAASFEVGKEYYIGFTPAE
jgi:hypothetical protein